MSNKLAGSAKALVAFVAAVLGALVVATQDGSGVSLNEALVAASTGVATLALVYGVPNKPLNRPNP